MLNKKRQEVFTVVTYFEKTKLFYTLLANRDETPIVCCSTYFTLRFSLS